MNYVVKKYSFNLVLVLSSLALLFSYQNCGKVNFQRDISGGEGSVCVWAADIEVTPSQTSFTGTGLVSGEVVFSITDHPDLERIEVDFDDGSPLQTYSDGTLQFSHIFESDHSRDFVVSFSFFKKNESCAVIKQQVVIVINTTADCSVSSSLSGPNTGYVGQSLGYQVELSNCPASNYRVDWHKDYNLNQDVDFSTLDTPTASWSYDRPGVYHIRAVTEFLSTGYQAVSEATVEIVCPVGQIVSPSGECVCPSGQDLVGGVCVPVNNSCNLVLADGTLSAPHGESRSVFLRATTPPTAICGFTCSGDLLKCDNGVFKKNNLPVSDGSQYYLQQSTCINECTVPQECVVEGYPNITKINVGQSLTKYGTEGVACGANACASQTKTCTTAGQTLTFGPQYTYTDSGTCVAQIPSCQTACLGSVPSYGVKCSGDGLTTNSASWTLTSTCSDTKECKYTCNTSTHDFVNGECKTKCLPGQIRNSAGNCVYTGTWIVTNPPACTTTCGYAGGMVSGTVTCSSGNTCDPSTKPIAPSQYCNATPACAPPDSIEVYTSSSSTDYRFSNATTPSVVTIRSNEAFYSYVRLPKGATSYKMGTTTINRLANGTWKHENKPTATGTEVGSHADYLLVQYYNGPDAYHIGEHPVYYIYGSARRDILFKVLPSISIEIYGSKSGTDFKFYDGSTPSSYSIRSDEAFYSYVRLPKGASSFQVLDGSTWRGVSRKSDGKWRHDSGLHPNSIGTEVGSHPNYILVQFYNAGNAYHPGEHLNTYRYETAQKSVLFIVTAPDSIEVYGSKSGTDFKFYDGSTPSSYSIKSDEAFYSYVRLPKGASSFQVLDGSTWRGVSRKSDGKWRHDSGLHPDSIGTEVGSHASYILVQFHNAGNAYHPGEHLNTYRYGTAQKSVLFVVTAPDSIEVYGSTGSATYKYSDGQPETITYRQNQTFYSYVRLPVGATSYDVWDGSNNTWIPIKKSSGWRNGTEVDVGHSTRYFLVRYKNPAGAYSVGTHPNKYRYGTKVKNITFIITAP